MTQPDTDALVSGNGRIEATEINISSKLPGQLEEVLVKEGDFVDIGKPFFGGEIVPLTVKSLAFPS